MPLRLATYNVLAQAYIKPKRYPHCAPQALSREPRQTRIVEDVCALDADIICLQELEPACYTALRDALPDYHGVYVQRPRSPDGCAILSAPHVSSGTSHTLIYEAHPRHIALVRDFELPTSGLKLTVASTHLKWQRRSIAREKHVGRRQLVELLDYAETASRGAHWFIAGDFNARPESSVVKAATARGWCLGCQYQHPWNTTNINGRKRKIDFILYRSHDLTPTPLPLPELEAHTPMPSERFPSDHLPVCVDFS